MTTKTIKINNTSNCTTCPFHNANYSTILDNIIAANIKANNKYLFDYKDKRDDLISALIADSKKNSLHFSSGIILNENEKFLKAANFIANYGKTTYKKLPFIIGKIYKLIDGTPICFYDDEIQIGYDIYSYNDFSNITFLNTLSAPKKDIIINIFNAGNKNIKINII